ncbi:hypothetical protein ACA910_000643 [Epithemia clementina (nom. ined.)]
MATATNSSSNTNTNNNRGGIWEGLGGPVQVDDHRSLAARMIDPTLDSCCQREMEDNLRMGAIRRTLQRHDVVAERERRRRNLVDASGFQGCRCLYDPQLDGGDYPTLLKLRNRRRRRQQQQRIGGTREEIETKELYCVGIQQEQENGEKQHKAELKRSNDENDVKDDDDDDEYDYLLDEDLPGQSEELQLIEEQRRAELEMEILQREIQLQHGYGVHRQMHPSRVLKAAGLVPGCRDPTPFVVLHLMDSESMLSASLDFYLEELATRMRGTKFMRSAGRSTFQMESSLVQSALPRLRADRDLPVLIAIKHGVAVQTSPLQNFAHRHQARYGSEDENDDDGDENGILEDAVYDWLHHLGVLHEQPPHLESLCRIRPEEAVLMDYLVKQGKPKSQFEDFFQCGFPGCQKMFAHQHVGIETKEQSGLVVPESEIIGG